MGAAEQFKAARVDLNTVGADVPQHWQDLEGAIRNLFGVPADTDLAQCMDVDALGNIDLFKGLGAGVGLKIKSTPGANQIESIVTAIPAVPNNTELPTAKAVKDHVTGSVTGFLPNSGDTFHTGSIAITGSNPSQNSLACARGIISSSPNSNGNSLEVSNRIQASPGAVNGGLRFGPAPAQEVNGIQTTVRAVASAENTKLPTELAVATALASSSGISSLYASVIIDTASLLSNVSKTWNQFYTAIPSEAELLFCTPSMTQTGLNLRLNEAGYYIFYVFVKFLSIGADIENAKIEWLVSPSYPPAMGEYKSNNFSYGYSSFISTSAAVAAVTLSDCTVMQVITPPVIIMPRLYGRTALAGPLTVAGHFFAVKLA